MYSEPKIIISKLIFNESSVGVNYSYHQKPRYHINVIARFKQEPHNTNSTLQKLSLAKLIKTNGKFMMDI